MISTMGAYEYRADTHPVHERNELLEKEIERLKAIIDGLRLGAHCTCRLENQLGKIS